VNVLFPIFIFILLPVKFFFSLLANGWEFLEQYKHLDAKQKARVTIVILTTSANPDDIKKAKQIQEVTGFETKPLSKEIMTELLNEHFKDYI